MRSTSASSAEEALPGWLWTAVTAVLCLMLGYALVAMPLAMASALRPLPALALSLVAAGALFALLRRPGPGAATRPDARVAPAAAVVIAAAATLLNARYSSEHVIADRDPGIYLWFGRWLADHGSLFLDNPRHLFPHVTGGVLAQCPETCQGAPGDRLYVQFLHLLPATLAAGAWIGGSALMVKVNAVIGGLSLVT